MCAILPVQWDDGNAVQLKDTKGIGVSVHAGLGGGIPG